MLEEPHLLWKDKSYDQETKMERGGGNLFKIQTTVTHWAWAKIQHHEQPHLCFLTRESLRSVPPGTPGTAACRLLPFRDGSATHTNSGEYSYIFFFFQFLLFKKKVNTGRTLWFIAELILAILAHKSHWSALLTSPTGALLNHHKN